ncbi:hypothetical protein [Marivita cryptomonadis]
MKFVNDMVILKRETGGLSRADKEMAAHGKLSRLRDWIRRG